MRTLIDFGRLAQFKYAVINSLGPDGYPHSVPTEFEITASKKILLNKPESQIPLVGRNVGVLFNHITAIPTGGYTDRRYMLIWGTLVETGGKLELQPSDLTEWDEKTLPFPELCARAAPQGEKYLKSLQPQLEA